MRKRLLTDLLEHARPVAEILNDLSAYPWDCEEDLVQLESQHIASMLELFLRGDASAADVEDWANAIECREDVKINGASPEGQVLEKLANPVLKGPITMQAASRWLIELRSEEC